MTWLLVTPAGLYLDDAGGWTRERAAARVFTARSAAQRVLRTVRRREGVELRLEPVVADVRPPREGAMSPAQRFALELVALHGALRCAGDRWVPVGARSPRIAPITVRSLVRRGELAVTVEGPSHDGRRRFGLLRHRRRWLEVRAREGGAAA
jgi:hypothetical protein